MPGQATRAATIKRLEEYNIRERLVELEHNPLLHKPVSGYSANTKLYPDGKLPFVDKHMAYLMDHPKLNPEQYLANLRLMLKKHR